jgi:hypothetical protein
MQPVGRLPPPIRREATKCGKQALLDGVGSSGEKFAPSIRQRNFHAAMIGGRASPCNQPFAIQTSGYFRYGTLGRCRPACEFTHGERSRLVDLAEHEQLRPRHAQCPFSVPFGFPQ